ncbi:DUF6636 domain-containing protein [Cellulomonas massiliensis]|uniref:DUF6636 domain-containing protein n=1 Tax=Cellulomonas massiliensis TaxID=1465811 RepID=UPI0002EF6BFD|nr:DUF6636 domain-containing protein [Cellulomonas massiliensis]
MSRTIRIWVVVDLVLVVIALVLLAVWMSGGSGTPGGEGTGGTASASAEPTPGGSAGPKAQAFQLPSGNIRCAMSGDGVTCTIRNIAYDPPAVPGCNGETGHVVALNEDGFAFVCVDGSAPAVPEGPVLEYGSQASVDGYTCRSASDGVTCTRDDGTGFKLARAKWQEVG